MIIYVAVVVVGVVAVVIIIFVCKRKPRVKEEAAQTPLEEAPAKPEKAALLALEDRYAKGEISKEEYEKLKPVLEKE